MRTVPSTLAVAAATTVLALTGPALAAATTYTVAAGSQTSGKVAYTAASGQIAFKTSSGLTLGCTSGTAAGTFTLSTKSKGKKVGLITKSTFTGCRGPANLPLNVTQVGKWAVNVAGTPSGGVTQGTITAISAKVSDTNGQCSFNVTGSVAGNFNQNNQSLNVVAPTSGPLPLTLSNVQGCFGAILNGDTASFGASYAVSNNVGPITITKN